MNPAMKYTYCALRHIIRKLVDNMNNPIALN